MTLQTRLLFIRHRILPHAVVLVVLTLLWALFFWRLLTPAQADRVIFPAGDFTQHYFAFSDYQVERLARGEFPLWNPYNHAGDPFAANIQFVAFYPPRLLAAVVSGGNWSIEAYQLEVAAHYWLASVMAYAFFMVVIKRIPIALVGSILYAYSGYLTGYPMLQVSVLESVIWLPLIMLGTHLSISRHGWRWIMWGGSIAGIGIALSLFGGHPQTTMQLAYLALAYLAFMTYQQKMGIVAFILRAGLMGGIGAGLSMIQLLPAAEFTSLSYRVTQLGFEDKANGFVAADFLQVMFPQLFGVWSPLYLGVAGFLLAVGAMLRPKPIYAFWMGVIAVAIFLSLGGNSIVFDFFYVVVPGFSIFRQQERIASVMVFALVTLAVYQLDWLLYPAASSIQEDQPEAQQRKRFTRFVYAYAAFLVIVYVFGTVVNLLRTDAVSSNPMDAASIFGFVTIIGGMFAIWLAWVQHSPGKTKSILTLVIPLVLLMVVDLFTIGTRSENYLPDVPENRVQPRPALIDLPVTPQEFQWRIDGAAGIQGNSVFFRLPDIYGTGPFSLESIETLRQIPVERFWEVLSVRYVTAVDEPPVDKVEMELLAYDVNYTDQEYKLFEIKDPRPMAYLVYDYRDSQGSAEFARQIMSDARVNLREMAVTLTPLPFELPGERPEISQVENFHMITPEHMEMTVSTEANALLTVSVMNYPGWKAYIDGEQIDIIDTYAGLIGIPVQSGENQQMRLEFKPDSVRFGATATGLTALLVIIGCIAVAYLPSRASI